MGRRWKLEKIRFSIREMNAQWNSWAGHSFILLCSVNLENGAESHMPRISNVISSQWMRGCSHNPTF